MIQGLRSLYRRQSQRVAVAPEQPTPAFSVSEKCKYYIRATDSGNVGKRPKPSAFA
jgi:hypothetical protein